MTTNFTNGSIVFRAWGMLESGEILAKFQYFSDANAWAKLKAEEDAKKRDHKTSYIAICDHENKFSIYHSTGQLREKIGELGEKG